MREIIGQSLRRLEEMSSFIWLAFFLVLLVCIAVFWPHYTFMPEQPSHQEISNTPTIEDKKPSLAKVDMSSLSQDIVQIINTYPELQIGVVVHDIYANEVIQVGQDEPFEAASVAKLVSAMAYVYYIENGDFTLDDPLGDVNARVQIQRMLRVSDNVAWKLVNDRITKPRLEEFAAKFSLTGYNPYENYIRPTDIAKLLYALYTLQIVDWEYVNFLYANLEFDSEQYQYIRSSVPEYIEVYHKSGWLKDRVHEATVVEIPGRPIVLVVFSKSDSGVYDFERGKKLFDEVTKRTVAGFSLP